MTCEVRQTLVIFVTERCKYAPTLKVDVVGLEIVAEACRNDARRAIEQISDRIVEVVIGAFSGQRLRAGVVRGKGALLAYGGVGSGHERGSSLGGAPNDSLSNQIEECSAFELLRKLWRALKRGLRDGAATGEIVQSPACPPTGQACATRIETRMRDSTAKQAAPLA